MTNDPIKVGEHVYIDHPLHYAFGQTVRVMAIADKYAMVRYKGAMPFTVPVKELTRTRQP